MYHLHTNHLEFEWDPLKDRRNRRKHGVSFTEAATAFKDKHAGLYFDPDHSHSEERFLLLGLSEKTRLLVVSRCYRRNGTHIRIISARTTTPLETAEYGETLK
jgi:uncharacterized DUF497 family protein